MHESAPKRECFLIFSNHCSRIFGSRWAFSLAVFIVVVWALTGPHYRYSDTWQLVINTGTTIVTFLMVFLIQSTQNRDAKAINLKLNEIVFAIGRAKNDLSMPKTCQTKNWNNSKRSMHASANYARCDARSARQCLQKTRLNLG